MRLFRRTLLCLVVGVTAFGVAGWLLRPKPHWTVAGIAAGWMPRFLNRLGEHLDQTTPIWFAYTLRDDGVMTMGTRVIECRDFKTGELIRRLLDRRGDVMGVRASGELLLSVKDFQEDVGAVEFVEIVSPVANSEETILPLENGWSISNDGQKRWHWKSNAMRLSMSVADLANRASVKRHELLGYNPSNSESLAVSPAGRYLAICESTRRLELPPFGIIVFDLETGVLIRTVPPPPGAITDAILASPVFEGEYKLNFTSLTRGQFGSSRWQFDIATGEYRRLPIRPASEFPVVAQGDAEPRYQRHNRICQAATRDPDAVWFCVETDGGPNSWRRVPQSLASLQHPSDGMLVWEVPNAPAVIAKTTEPPLIAALPENVRRHLKRAWSQPRNESKCRWHSLESGQWLDIGCRLDVEMIEPRSGALLTLSEVADQPWLLQSWPLPPRDPKWPALGVAALCTAATWWLCARRFRKRMRLASIGAP
jgi:hypothetical protein